MQKNTFEEDACSTMIINIAIAVGVMIVSCMIRTNEEEGEG